MQLERPHRRRPKKRDDEQPTMTASEARQHINRISNSFDRMDHIIELYKFQTGVTFDVDEWERILGEKWTSCDRIRTSLANLRLCLGTRGPKRNMMTAEENAAYDALPDTVSVYRGCDKSAMTGACWSLNRRVANRFPFLIRFRAISPVLVTARVKKNRILAVKLGRGEEEIITFSARRVNVEPANPALAEEYGEEVRQGIERLYGSFFSSGGAATNTPQVES
jgi:hypothetical protein